MNYFAHGRDYVDDPYFLAGTAVPDWLSVIDRKVRARTRLAKPFVDDADDRVAAVARGIVQHHFDDDWFHRTRAFAELSLDFTVAVRDRLDQEGGFRPSFLGHILVELLLDALLVADEPARLDAYYRAVDSLDAVTVGKAVNLMTTKQTMFLSELIPRFSAERFLYDYMDDAKLLYRLNGVMRRVKLPQLPATLADWFPQARAQVQARRGELLTQPTSP